MNYIEINKKQSLKDKIRNFFVAPRKMKIMNEVFRFIHKCEIKGDYYEFGVWKGESFVRAHQMRQTYRKKDMHMWGFDSFEGLPEEDPDIKRYVPGQYSCDMDQVNTTLQKYGVNKFSLIPGFFDEALNDNLKQKHPFKKASIVLFDGDLYSSCRDAINWITPFIQDGTVFMFDSWWSHRGNSNRGEKKALKEWLESNSKWEACELYNHTTYGMGFVINDRTI